MLSVSRLVLIIGRMDAQTIFILNKLIRVRVAQSEEISAVAWT